MAKCSLCGEPMPPGEEMFKFHGFSGPCPAPTKAAVSLKIDARGREDQSGEWWLDIFANGELSRTIGPFTSSTECQRAADDLLEMLVETRPQ